MKIVVTGGCGFIGSHFIDYISNLDHEISIIDNFTTGKKSHLELAQKKCEINIIKEDIRDIEKIKSSCKNADVIVHFAAMTGIIESLEKPIEFSNVNVIGTLNLLEICKEYKIPKFVFASTGAVYGEQTPPFKENMMVSPISPYAASKIAAENYCKAYAETFGISCSILRFSNVFGPRKSFGPYANVIPKFVRSGLKKEPITIFGNGEQERDFVFVKDIAKACFLAASHKNFGIFNIATGINTSVNNLIEKIEIELGYSLIKNYVDFRKGEVQYAYSSIEKAQNELEYTPDYNLEKGLKEYVEYEKKLS